MKRRALTFLLLTFPVLCLAQSGGHGGKLDENSHITAMPETLHWTPLPQEWLKGMPPKEFGIPKAEIAIVSGDPTRSGDPFVLRIKMPDGERIPPHWHPQAENVTVLQGTMVLGQGETFDPNSGQELPVGGFALIPARHWHYARSKGESIVQVHGVGPFTINFEPMKGTPSM